RLGHHDPAAPRTGRAPAVVTELGEAGVRVEAHVPAADESRLAAVLARYLGTVPTALTTVALPVVDWSALARRHHRPRRVGERLLVAPPWDVPVAPVLAGTAHAVRGSFDLVVANLLAELIVADAKALAGCVAPGGCLILSGLLDEQATAVQRAFPGWRLTGGGSEDGWRTLVLARDVP